MTYIGILILYKLPLTHNCASSCVFWESLTHPLQIGELPLALLMLHGSSARERSESPVPPGKRGQRMATILPFVSNKIDFDDEATRIMGEAFDAACLGLQDTGQPALVREIIAQRIIEAAKKGERDPARLRAAGLAALGYDREAI